MESLAVASGVSLLIKNSKLFFGVCLGLHCSLTVFAVTKSPGKKQNVSLSLSLSSGLQNHPPRSSCIGFRFPSESTRTSTFFIRASRAYTRCIALLYYTRGCIKPRELIVAMCAAAEESISKLRKASVSRVTMRKEDGRTWLARRETRIIVEVRCSRWRNTNQIVHSYEFFAPHGRPRTNPKNYFAALLSTNHRRCTCKSTPQELRIIIKNYEIYGTIL